jgi:hypothetical protein
MSQDKALHDHQKRIMLANSITSVLAYRFPWLHVNATADNALRAYFGKMLADGNDNGLTLEAAMGAILDALQAENAEVKRQFVAYVERSGRTCV